MLVLKQITKNYEIADNIVHALRGVDLEFRKSEFVAILGPSGCGKTTLLNIIGGLDRYTDGDLIINQKSTKDFTDGDWDAYRNRSIGFVFQNYNLIPHQTVLGNVELALTLSGVSKVERKLRAKAALEKVGLGDQLSKHPNQMSGGQMQRVAIARALVNNPDIILADEPTGALDTETSVQVMEILKEISKDKLIIMVTHNPDLAKSYATRTIRLVDGNIIDDSHPYHSNQAQIKEIAITKKKRAKTSMSFMTALSLSLRNLFTKKMRTFLTAFAGSIGIIGIALILSLSSGFQNYISKVEEETLSSYPVTIEKDSVNLMGMMNAMMEQNKGNRPAHGKDQIYSNDILADLFEAMSKQTTSNDLGMFKKYVEANPDKLKDLVTAVSYGYDIDLNIYNPDYSQGIYQLNPYPIYESMAGSMPMMSQMNVWTEMLDNSEFLESQYEMVKGSWPTSFDEVVLVVDKNNEISDFVLFALGLKPQKELEEMLGSIFSGQEIVSKPTQYTYDDILNRTYKMILNTDYYSKQADNTWKDMKKDKTFMERAIDNALELKITGIIRTKEDVKSSAIRGAIGYSSDLTKYIVNTVNHSEIVKQQKADPTTSVLDGAELTKLELDKIYKTLGVLDLEEPNAINLYPVSFEAKEKLVAFIDEYNRLQIAAGLDNKTLTYTDYVGMMMSSITDIINTISYVLIAFVAISLIVSSIMIGIITYISVLERTKEIGVLRSIGASKKDISRVFNAETMIVGFVAGLIGILVTVLLTIPVNLIINALANIGNVAQLPIIGAVILIVISMALTLIAGLIPAKIAAKKDPVVALRTE